MQVGIDKLDPTQVGIAEVSVTQLDVGEARPSQTSTVPIPYWLPIYSASRRPMPNYNVIRCKMKTPQS